MTVLDLFSKRQKKLRGEVPDVYVYDDIPENLRVQVVHIWRDAFGNYDSYGSRAPSTYEFVYSTLCREYGLFTLVEFESGNRLQDLANFLLSTEDVEKVMDCVELSFRCIDKICREPNYKYESEPQLNPDQAIVELNQRFLEHAVGYQYEAGYIMKMDSKLIHADVVKPALAFLNKSGFEGANQEFLLAHEHYRHGRYKECLNECLKALESTLKTICKIRKWSYKDKDTASILINICFENNLVPTFLQSEFTSLRSTLESGVPTIRNKVSGHGQGTVVVKVPSYLAAYQLHLTATTILFLVEASEAFNS